MKKLFLVLTSMCLFTLFSCSSIPKDVKPNQAIVIGGATAVLHGYTSYGDLSLSGEFRDGIEITITECGTTKTSVVKPNKDGFFCIKNLKPGCSYEITALTCRVSSDAGMMSTGVNFSEPRVFTCEGGQLSNVGTIYVDFDGETGECQTVISDYNFPVEYFAYIAADSAWLEAPLVEY